MLSNRRGFSLFEFIMVVGIITCLVMLFAPVISRVTQDALRTRCQGNLRSLHQAFEQYRTVNKGRYPFDKNNVGSSLLLLRDYLPDVESYIRCPASKGKGSYAYDYNHSDNHDETIVMGDSAGYDEELDRLGVTDNHGGLAGFFLRVNGNVTALFGTVYQRRNKVNRLQLLDDIYMPDPIHRDFDSYLVPIDL